MIYLRWLVLLVTLAGCAGHELSECKGPFMPLQPATSAR